MQANEQDKIKHSIQADHEIIANAVVNFHLLFDRARTPEADRELADVQRLFQAKIAQHFADEDKDLFPALLLKHPDPTTAKVIAELVQEHADLLEELRKANARIDQRELKSMTGEVWVLMLHFFNQLQNHMDKEDALLAQFK